MKNRMLSKLSETISGTIGDWNPQLLRELKGRWKLLPLLLAIGLSLCGQLLLWSVTAYENMPGARYEYWNRYCSLSQAHQQQRRQLQSEYRQRQDQFFRYSSADSFDAAKVQSLKSQIETVKKEHEKIENLAASTKICPDDRIDWQAWKADSARNIFIRLSSIGVVALIVGGSYLISHDLIKEKQRGTLNFVRMSPQSAASILIGKLIGVPIFVYIFTGLAIPLHVYSSHSAGISWFSLLTFYAVAIAGSLCFYGLTLVLSLSDRILKSILPWLLSGFFLVFLTCSWYWADSQSNSLRGTAGIWGLLLSPFCHLQYLIHQQEPLKEFHDYFLYKLKFFDIPIGENQFHLALVMLGSYILWIYWLWKASIRSFQTPDNSLLTKSQSYLAVLCYEMMLLACTTIPNEAVENYVLINKLAWLGCGNLLLFFALIFMLTPQRQTVQDWARFRHQQHSSQLAVQTRSLKADLLQGEKSPAILAIAINLAIAAIPLLLMSCVTTGSIHKNTIGIQLQFQHGMMVLLFLMTIAIAATLAQIVLMQKSSKRSVWAMGIVSSIFFFFPMVLTILNMTNSKYHLFWLISIFPWQAFTKSTLSEILTAFLVEFLVLGTLFWQLQRQLKLAGQSDSKVLLSQT
jgi:ABC-2 family transporter protein